jgi:pimeloyl-ACP methyl ester carboxylesterase
VEGPVSPERTDIDVEGGRLAVYRFGDPDAAPVLAVHGITANSHSWLAVGRALGGRASLLAVDLRGRGRSNCLPGPYGISAYVADLLAVLDRLEVDRGVVAGHSLGAYILARLAADHPERVSSIVLVDGGLSAEPDPSIDPQKFIEGFLGPALARLQERFPSREAYRAWWRRHPSFTGPEISDHDLNEYADHDLVGEPPELRSSVLEEAVRADAGGLFEMGEPARRLSVPATLIAAELGLLNEPNPVQPTELVDTWVADAPHQRSAQRVPGTNHYTLILGAAGARVVADAIAERVVATRA